MNKLKIYILIPVALILVSNVLAANFRSRPKTIITPAQKKAEASYIPATEYSVDVITVKDNVTLKDNNSTTKLHPNENISQNQWVRENKKYLDWIIFYKSFPYEYTSKKLYTSRVTKFFDNKQVAMENDIALIKTDNIDNFTVSDQISFIIEEGKLYDNTSVYKNIAEGIVLAKDNDSYAVKIIKSYEPLELFTFAAKLNNSNTDVPSDFTSVQKTVKGEIVFLQAKRSMIGSGVKCIANIGYSHGVKKHDIVKIVRKKMEFGFERSQDIAKGVVLNSDENYSTIHIVEAVTEVQEKDSLEIVKSAIYK